MSTSEFVCHRGIDFRELVAEQVGRVGCGISTDLILLCVCFSPEMFLGGDGMANVAAGQVGSGGGGISN